MSSVYNPRDTEPSYIRKYNERPNVIKVYAEDWDTDRGVYLRCIRLIPSEFPSVYTHHWRYIGDPDNAIIPPGTKICHHWECVNPCCYET